MHEVTPTGDTIGLVHPGTVIRARIDELGLSVSAVADRLAMSRASLNNLLEGRSSLTPATALKVERVLGTSSRLLLNFDSAYHLHEAEQERRREEADEADWAQQFPIPWMQRMAPLMGLSPGTDWEGDPAGSVFAFFGVENRRAFEASVPGALPRVSHHADRDPLAIRAWLRVGESRARHADLPEYDRARFTKVVELLPSMTRHASDAAGCFRAIQDAFAAAGVHLDLVTEPPGSKLNGACFWVSPRRPAILVTGRLKRGDVLWFTVAHEAMHVLHHGKSDNYISLDSSPSADLEPDGVPEVARPEEADADYRAAQLLIPPQLATKLTGGLTKAKVESLAGQHEIHPEILVGRLLHLGLLRWDRKWVHQLRRKFEPEDLQPRTGDPVAGRRWLEGG